MADPGSRYDRQTLLRGIGAEGQAQLADSTVFVLGCGALGSFAAELLTRAGVGHLVIVDRDFVEWSNLQRQILFTESDAREALPKAVAAKRNLRRIDSSTTISAIVDDVNHGNIAEFAAEADLIVDGLDNLETRYLANDLSVRDAVPYLYGAVVGTTGMAFSVLPHGKGSAAWEAAGAASPCFRCLFEELPPPGSTPTCDTVGVLNTAVAQVAALQLTDALKILTGNYAELSGALSSFDLWSNEFRQLRVAGVREASDCPCCKQRNFEFLDGRTGSTAAVLCGRNAVQLRPRGNEVTPSLDALAARLENRAEVRSNQYMLRAEIDDGGHSWQLSLFRDGRAIIKGTDSIDVARSVYARFVGT